MPQGYADLQFRLHVGSPVAADSPFESDTLWGRVLCALYEGNDAQQALARFWLDEMTQAADPDWQPPLILSEGLQCDPDGNPWVPLPLGISHRLQGSGDPCVQVAHADAPERRDEHSRKDLKKIEWVPLGKLAELCEGKPPDPGELIGLDDIRPRTKPALQPHLGMNRATSAATKHLLYMAHLDVYSLAEIAFLVKLRQDVNSELVRLALKRVCDEGWGHSKSRGLGQIRFKSFDPWKAKPQVTDKPTGFVTLSYFCPRADDPVEGYWKLAAKHPVPAQFVGGQRVVLGSRKEWRARSLLRLAPGSCFWFREGRGFEEHYGRMIGVRELLQPPNEGDPPLFHYALAYPWPIALLQR